MSAYPRLPGRTAELRKAIRGECPPDLLPELDEYLFAAPPHAARLLPEWGGLCEHDGEILVDPDCRRFLKVYLHELAHCTVGTIHGHDTHFAQIAEALYVRFRVEYTRDDLLYDIHEAHEYFQYGAPAQRRATAAQAMAQEALTVEKLANYGQASNAALARAEWCSVIVPLIWVGLLGGIGGLLWLVRDYSQWVGIGACALAAMKLSWDWIRAD